MGHHQGQRHSVVDSGAHTGKRDDSQKRLPPKWLQILYFWFSGVSVPHPSFSSSSGFRGTKKEPKRHKSCWRGPWFRQHSAFTHSCSGVGRTLFLHDAWRHGDVSLIIIDWFSSWTCPTLLIFSHQPAFSMFHLENIILRTAFYSALAFLSICYTQRALNKQSWAFLSRLFPSGNWSASVKTHQACSVCFTCKSPLIFILLYCCAKLHRGPFPNASS